MALNKADFVGIDNILNWYETNAEQPYYSVWQGKLLKFGYNEDDKDKGSVLLQDNLMAYQQGGHNEVLILKLHPKKEKGGFITDKTPISASANFRVNELQPYVGLTPYFPQNNSGNDAIMQKLNGIESRLTAIEEEPEDYEENEQQQPQKISGLDILNNLLQQPHIQEKLINFGVSLLNKIVPPKQPPAMAINGINDIGEDINDIGEDERLRTAIESLKQVRPQIVEDLVGLAHIAQTDPSKLGFILSMLPK